MTCLNIQILKGGIPVWVFICSTISLESINKSQRPIFTANIYHFPKNMFNIAIRNFNFVACLWIIRSCNFMNYAIFFINCSKTLLQKCFSLLLIISWILNLGKILSLKYLTTTYDHLFYITWNSFYLFWNIINSNKNIKITKRIRRRTHEINAPHIK